MKKMAFIVSLILCGSSVFAQSTIRVSAGYGLSLNSDLLMEQVREGIDVYSNFYQNVKGIYGSLGSGFTLNAAFSRPFVKGSPLSWDLENTFLLGKKYISRSEIYDGSYNPLRTERRAMSYQITPSLVYNFTLKNLTPYVCLGPTFGFTKIVTDVSTLTSNLLRIEYSYEYKGGLSVGIKTAIGASMKVSPIANVFGEISFTNMTYAPKKGWLTDYDVEGKSELDEFTTKERTIKLEEEYTLHPDDEQIIQTRERYSMGAIALNLGVRLTFGSQTKQ
jgi:hypothetical protein